MCFIAHYVSCCSIIYIYSHSLHVHNINDLNTEVFTIKIMQLKLHHCAHNISFNNGSRFGIDIDSHMFTLEVGFSKRKYFIDNGSGY